jgi:DNA (cytosine-5)-methyltransferase 1
LVTSRQRSTGPDPKYTQVLVEAFTEAQALLLSENSEAAIESFISNRPELTHPLKTDANGAIIPLGKTVAEGVRTILSNLQNNRYIYSILITGLVEKVIHPQQDIRLVQTDMQGGYSNRNTDQRHITPNLKTLRLEPAELKNLRLTHMAASGMESGRNMERPESHTFGHSANMRGVGTKDAYLGIIHAVQEEAIAPKPIITLLMALDLLNKQAQEYAYPKPTGLTIQQIVDAVSTHCRDAKGNGRARLPVLAIQAVYRCLVPQLERYKETKHRNPANRHTGNDKMGWVGDVQVDRLDDTPFEAVEVKAEKPITADMIRALPGKFRGQAVNRYYVLSTSVPFLAKGEQDEVRSVVNEVREQTGCEVIVNGWGRSLWYYLRMIDDPNLFLEYYTEQLESDMDVQPTHRKLWAEILEGMVG